MKRGVLIILIVFSLLVISNADSACVSGLKICGTDYWCSTQKSIVESIPGYICCPMTPTCSDGTQNQGETGVDCGGPCPPCSVPLPVICTTFTLSPILGLPNYIVTADVNDNQCKICDYRGCSGSNCAGDSIRDGDGTFSAPSSSGTFRYYVCSGGILKTITVQTPGCTEAWTCTDWSACSGEIQTRTCTDSKNCGTTNNKPTESQDCTVSSVGTYSSKYIGCYTDTSSRALPNKLGNMNIDQCANAARDYVYFAMQCAACDPDPNGAECWAGNSGYNKYGSATCTSRDSSGNYIGDAWINAVYRSGGTPTPSCTASCPSCIYSDICVESALGVTCTSADCSTYTQSCTRDTDRQSCGTNKICQNGVCVSSCNPNTGAVCYSPQNACGQVGTGTVKCDGTCNALTPANPVNYGVACGCGGTKDCNGNCVGGTPLITYYRDADSDGYGDPLITKAECSKPAGYVTNAQDCDDTTNLKNPGNAEICTDGIDNNCNSLIDCKDSSCAGKPNAGGKTCCISVTQCTCDQACDNYVCVPPPKTGNSKCCYGYTECMNLANQNKGNSLKWPQPGNCVCNGIVENPDCI